MGILNVTPDSFSDGGQCLEERTLADRLQAMLVAGVDIIDVGGESTRPFADPVPMAVELARVVPAIESIRRLNPRIPISIDTSKAEVARAALAAGADIINDVSALRFDPDMVRVAVTANAPVILMHMQGTPADMQIAPRYTDVVSEITTFLQERICWAEQQGLPRQRILVDPGLGFGKTEEHNLTILKRLREFRALGCPVLVGHSRKGFLGRILDVPVQDRDVATAVVSAYCTWQGAHILRVHDVLKTVQAVRLIGAVMQAP
jgi:dihydropteroate synthase